MEKSKSILVVLSVVVGALVVYLVVSYTQLIGTKTYVVNEEQTNNTVSDVVVATSLECKWNSDNSLEAILRVKDSVEDSAALPAGSVLADQTIQWSVAESLGRITPAPSVTDSEGVARSQFEQISDVEIPVIIAAFEEGRIEIEKQGSNATVRYGASWCELSPPTL